jgi:uncharacterized protein with HEPN domain
MRDEDRVRVAHMVDAIEAALRFTQGRSRSDLDGDEMLLFALVRAVEIVGEAASRVSTEGRSETPDVPWGVIIGMRNRLVHAYFDIDRGILWTTVMRALPPLLPTLRSVLEARR